MAKGELNHPDDDQDHRDEQIGAQNGQTYPAPG